MAYSSRISKVRTPSQLAIVRAVTPDLPTIAIIGGGLSGALVAIYLLRAATRPLQIKLIERRSQLGMGLAYSTLQDCHLLNVPANKISAFAEAPNHFLDWLHQHVDRSLPASAFVPRKYYGQYIQASLQQAIANAAPQVQVQQITDEAVSIQPDNKQLVIALGKGDRQFADQVVLALGNPPPSPLPFVDPLLRQSLQYICSATSGQRLSCLEPDATVLLVGSGLTAVDVVLTLRHQGHRGVIHLLSRRGLLPRSHQPAAAQPTAARLTVLQPTDWHRAATPLTTRELLQQIRAQINRANATGQDWRSVLDALRPHTQTLWQNLPLAEKRRFLRHVRPYWDVHRHRLAPSIAQQMDVLLQERRIVLHAGRVQSCQADATGVEVLIRERGSTALHQLRVQAVVNCTGSAGDYRQSANPLMVNLLDAGLTRPDPLHLGLDVDTDGAAIAADGTSSSQLYTLGFPKRGLLWETTAIPEIREQARALAKRLMLNLATNALPTQLEW